MVWGESNSTMRGNNQWPGKRLWTNPTPLTDSGNLSDSNMDSSIRRGCVLDPRSAGHGTSDME